MATNLADIIPAIFTGPNGEALSPEQIRDRQLIAQSLMAQATDTSPNAGGWASILAKGVQGFQAGRERRGADSAIAGNNTYNSDLVNSLLSGSSPNPSSSPLAASASTSGVAQEMAQTSPAPAVDISGDKETFVASLLPAAIEESKRTGVDPRIIVAQAAQETGWGRSAPGNNYFGIKSHGQGGGQNLATHEYINGKRVNVNDSFRTFESPADSVRGYGDFILKNPRYEGLRTAQGLDGQLQALQASGYATDPNYSRSVGAIARGIRLPETPAAAIEAAAPASSFRGSDYNSPMLTYDDRGARVERPYTDPAVSVQPQSPPQSGFDAGRFGDPAAAPASAPPMAGVAPEIYSAQTDFAPELPAPVNVAPAPAVAAVQQPVARPSQPVQAPASNPSAVAQALRVMADPRANEGTRRVAQALLQQEQQKQQFAQEQSVWQQRQEYEQQQQNNDPLRQLQIQKAQQELAGGSRQSLVNAGDGRIYDPNSQQWIQAPNSGQAKAPETQTFYDEQGREYRAQWNPESSSWERVGGSKLPSGMTIRTNPDGTFELIQGQAGGNLTEAQSKDAVYSTRARGALTTLDKFDTALTSLPERAAEYDPTGLSRSVQSPEFQQARQSGDEFLQAILRKDTGAAITSDEMASYGRTYLPAPGDGPELLAQKRVARSRALAALESGMPPQAILNQEKALEKSSKPEAAQSDDISRAKAAIAKGANREAVIKRLQDAGISTEGL